MDFSDFLQQVEGPLGPLVHYLESLTFVVPVLELVKISIAFIGLAISAYGVWKTWLYADKRIGKRLDEYLSKEDKRLLGVRTEIRRGLNNQDLPSISKHKIFSNKKLTSALRAMRWGSRKKARHRLEKGIVLSRLKRRLASRRVENHNKQIVLNNLLQGALLDADGDHRAALACFEAVLQQDPKDSEALQYAGLQYLRLGQTHRALDLFNELLDLARAQGDKLLEFQSNRNIGICYETDQLSQPGNANIAFRNAIEVFPTEGRRIDLADVHEKRAIANTRIQGNHRQASRSATDALTVYSSVQRAGGVDASEAERGVDRIHLFLSNLDEGRSPRLANENRSEGSTQKVSSA